jgi:hypothetical protein
MKRSLLTACCALALCSAGLVYAKLPPPSDAENARAIAARAKAAEEAKKEAAALARAQDRAVDVYKRSKSGPAVASAAAKGEKKRTPVKAARGKIERLACRTGDEDRHARIGVELVDNKVNSFAYYSKWKPRTCSIEVTRGGAYSRWEDNGVTSKVILTEDKGVFLVDRKGAAYRFVFRDVDRERYCGMDGKINGTLTVIRGKSQCVVHGIMDGHS